MRWLPPGKTCSRLPSLFPWLGRVSFTGHSLWKTTTYSRGCILICRIIIVTVAQLRPHQVNQNMVSYYRGCVRCGLFHYLTRSKFSRPSKALPGFSLSGNTGLSDLKFCPTNPCTTTTSTKTLFERLGPTTFKEFVVVHVRNPINEDQTLSAEMQLQFSCRPSKRDGKVDLETRKAHDSF